MKVTFLSPGGDDDPFYGAMARFARVAARALGIELEVIPCDRDLELLRERGREVAARPRPPEYLLLVNDADTAVELLPIACAASIEVLLVNEGLWVADRQRLGGPREELEGWLGELLPDDEQAGYLLAQTLVAEARRLGLSGEDGRIRIHGLTGSYTIASVLRLNGLRKAVTEHADIELGEVAPLNWDRERARQFTSQLLAREPDTHLIWAASDGMALGAAEAIEAAGRQPGREVLVGGIDWAPFALERVREGSLTATVGGHFMDGAWALVMLYDRHHGRDFRAATYRSSYVVLTRRNLPELSRMLDESAWPEIDFASFSKVRNPELEHYDFRLVRAG